MLYEINTTEEVVDEGSKERTEDVEGFLEFQNSTVFRIPCYGIDNFLRYTRVGKDVKFYR